MIAGGKGCSCQLSFSDVSHASGKRTYGCNFRVARHSGAKARNLNRAVPARLSHSWDNLR